MAMTKAQREAEAEARADAIAMLRTDFPRGTTVHTIYRRSTGTSHSISVLTVGEGGEIYDVSHLVARVVGSKLDTRNGGVKRTGGGMDMTYDLVYRLALELYDGDGMALKHRNL